MTTSSSVSINSSSSSSPISISGLASGLDTSEIISELMSIEREPVTHLTDEQAKVQAQQTALQGIATSLQSLATAVSEFSLPSLYESTQTVTSSEPARVTAATTSGAGVGGYEVEVTKLANSAQRTYTFTSPTAEQTITVGGQEFTLKAGETAKELARAINSNSDATVYAAALENGTLVLSSRATGAGGGEQITLSGAGETLVEVAGSAREGQDAEYSVDGVEGKSASNTVTTAIPGVTLTLDGLTTTSGPVTVDVQAPGVSVANIEAKVNAFVKLYNSTVEAIQKQLTTKPPSKASSSEYSTGILFADQELTGLLNTVRQAMYEPIAGLSAEMSSPFDIGVSTGASSGAVSSQTSLEGQLTVDSTTLTNAIEANPTGVQQMLEGWSQKLQGILEGAAGPGGTIEIRTNGDASEITQLNSQISSMNQMLAVREKALQTTYAELEAVISKNSAQSDWLTEQLESLDSSGG